MIQAHRATFGAARSSRAERYRSAAKRFQIEAKKWRTLMWKSGLFTKRRRDYERKANEAAAKAKEQMRLYRAAKKAANKAARAAKKAARGGGTQAAEEMESMEAMEAEDAALEEEIDASASYAPSAPSYSAAAMPPNTWLYVGGAAAVLGLALVLSRRGA